MKSADDVGVLMMVPSVGINVVGFDLPLVLSLPIAGCLVVYRHGRISKRSLGYHVAVFCAIMVASVVLFVFAPDPRSLSIPQSWSLSLMLGSGALYTSFFFKRRLIPNSAEIRR